MQGTTKDKSETETVPIESHTKSKFVHDVAEDLQTTLSGTLATKIELIGQTIKVHYKETNDVDGLWQAHRAAIDELYQWGYSSVVNDATDKTVDVFRMTR